MEFLVIFEDEHLLVVNKPAGLNTHAPSPYAGEGLYDWLRQREPRWADLAIVHRLDKETSGVLVFSKTTLANRSLTQQFTRRAVRKKYWLLTDRRVSRREIAVRNTLVRVGDRYRAGASGARGEAAETRFTVLDGSQFPEAQPPELRAATLVEAEPLTGRTHQIRVHAADSGFPILGDILYGGTPAPQVYLHAAAIVFHHPASGQELTFNARPDFTSDPRLVMRTALMDPESTDAFRLIHGAGDGWPGWYLDKLGDSMLSQAERPLGEDQRQHLARLMRTLGARGACHKRLTNVRSPDLAEVSPQLLIGEPAPDRFQVRENSLRFELSFNEGYSVGLFLDQRDNRRRLLTGHVAAGFELWPPRQDPGGGPPAAGVKVLNAFAYTCGFSVCAARAGARVVSLDLSRKYLEWGRRNFALNGLEPASHEFIQGDVFLWLKRLAKGAQRFDVVLLDPPTFSRSKSSGIFRAEKDYSRLVSAALPLLKPGGVLFASTNAADWDPCSFLMNIENAFRAGKRARRQQHYAPQPPDFPVTRAEPAYLKTVWVRAD